jgi:HAE1 family hydrophobic/amphiphilic exporter-1
MPLRSVVELELVQGPAEIRRVDNSRVVIVTAQASGLDLGGLSTRVEAALLDLETPKGVRWIMGGQKREMDETQESMRFALLLAIFLVYVVMAAQFESLIQPFVILLTVPLAGIGVIHALEWTDTPLSVVVFIGVIMLAGIVVNNAIVLVDRINQKRAAGLELKESILEAGRARLRPIMMTTATTALGLLPMTGLLAGLPIVGELGSGEGAEMRAPMAIAVISGLTSSTLLTLLVVPTVYRLLASFRLGPKQASPAASPTPQPADATA